jgi:hypothetical protein
LPARQVLTPAQLLDPNFPLVSVEEAQAILGGSAATAPAPSSEMGSGMDMGMPMSG